MRGDCAFGNERVTGELELIEQPYLFKLKQSAGVKRLIEHQFKREGWQDAGQGWQGLEDELQLMGWRHARRVVVLRRALRSNVVLERVASERAQQEIIFADENQTIKTWEYAVLVTNTQYRVMALGPLYRDRADGENGFDELKNQWGLSGYRLSLRLIERANAPITAHDGYARLDFDTFTMDNSGTKKEEVSRTYQGFDGYTPIAAYLGNEGWVVGLDLRPGKQHSALHTEDFLKEVFPRV